jgi:hypothetical protein
MGKKNKNSKSSDSSRSSSGRAKKSKMARLKGLFTKKKRGSESSLGASEDSSGASRRSSWSQDSTRPLQTGANPLMNQPDFGAGGTASSASSRRSSSFGSRRSRAESAETDAAGRSLGSFQPTPESSARGSTWSDSRQTGSFSSARGQASRSQTMDTQRLTELDAMAAADGGDGADGSQPQTLDTMELGGMARGRPERDSEGRGSRSTFQPTPESTLRSARQGDGESGRRRDDADARRPEDAAGDDGRSARRRQRAEDGSAGDSRRRPVQDDAPAPQARTDGSDEPVYAAPPPPVHPSSSAQPAAARPGDLLPNGRRRRRELDVQGIRYNKNDRDTDFKQMIESGDHPTTLFVFNDNADQARAFRSGQERGVEPGGGNGVIRPYQATGQARGIPTGDKSGQRGGRGFADLTPEVVGEIDAAVAEIKRHLLSPQGQHFDRIVFSADQDGDPGTGHFRVGNKVRRYIRGQLESMARDIGFIDGIQGGRNDNRPNYRAQGHGRRLDSNYGQWIDPWGAPTGAQDGAAAAQPQAGGPPVAGPPAGGGPPPPGAGDQASQDADSNYEQVGQALDAASSGSRSIGGGGGGGAPLGSASRSGPLRLAAPTQSNARQRTRRDTSEYDVAGGSNQE